MSNISYRRLDVVLMILMNTNKRTNKHQVVLLSESYGLQIDIGITALK